MQALREAGIYNSVMQAVRCQTSWSVGNRFVIIRDGQREVAQLGHHFGGMLTEINLSLIYLI